MKSLALGTTALALLLTAPAALASPDFKFQFGASANAGAAIIEQNRDTGLNDSALKTDAELSARVYRTTDTGIRLGLQSSVILNDGGRDRKNPDLDELYLYAQLAYGEFRIGRQDGAGLALGFFAPTVFRSARVNDSRLYMPEGPNALYFAPGLTPTPSAFTDWGGQPYRPVRLRTDLHASSNSTKFVYLTPRLLGIQAGFSWTPEFDANTPEFIALSAIEEFEQRNIWEAGINYQGNFGGIDVGASVTWLTGTTENKQVIGDGVLYGVEDDLEEWGFGLGLLYEGFRIGGSYRISNNAGGINPSFSVVRDFESTFTNFVSDDVDTTVWEIGGRYQTGPWSFGLNYIEGESQVLEFVFPGSDTLVDVDGRAWQAAASYTVSPGVSVGAVYENWRYGGDDPILGLDADVLMAVVELDVNYTP